MFQSPLKTVVEKIKPVDSKSSISSLRFERSSDFKKFIRFIKDETEQLEKIKLPSVTEVEPKSKAPSALGLFGLGFITLLTSAFGGGDGKKNFAIAGGTKSQFKPPELPLVGGLRNLQENPRPRSIRSPFRRDIKKRFGEKTRLTLRKKLVPDVKKQTRFQRRQRKVTKIRQTQLKNIQKQVDANNLVEKFFSAQDETFKEIQRLEKKYGLTKKGKFTIDDLQTFNRNLNLDPKLKALYNKLIADLEPDPEVDKIIKDIEAGNFQQYTEQDFKKAEELIKQEKEIFDAQNKKFEEALKNRKNKIIEVSKMEPNIKIGGFSIKDALENRFKKIGEVTKPFRSNLKTSLSKIPGSKTTFSFGKTVLRGAAKRFDILNAGIEAIKLIDGFIVGDNIVTSLYDLGVAFHNTFQPDKSKLKFFITKSRNAEKNRFIDKKNKKVLDAINKAKAAQGITNQVQANSGNSPSGGIIPFVKSSINTPFGVTLAPTVLGIKFITEKLYKQ